MDEFSATMVRLLACTLPGTLAPGITLVAPRVVVDNLLSGLLADTDHEAIAAAVTGVADGRLDVVTALGQASEVLTTLDADREARATLGSRLDAMARTLAQAQGLSAAMGGGSIARAEISLADPGLLALLQMLTLSAPAGAPEVIIVGTLAQTSSRQSIRFGRRTPLDRIEIAYTAESPYPLLTLTTASRGETVAWSSTRDDWRQEPDLDLVIQNTTGSRELGKIQTIQVTPPWSYEGARLSIQIPEVPGHTLLVTTVTDTGGRPLAHCARVFHTA